MREQLHAVAVAVVLLVVRCVSQVDAAADYRFDRVASTVVASLIT